MGEGGGWGGQEQVSTLRLLTYGDNWSTRAWTKSGPLWSRITWDSSNQEPPLQEKRRFPRSLPDSPAPPPLQQNDWRRKKAVKLLCSQVTPWPLPLFSLSRAEDVSTTPPHSSSTCNDSKASFHVASYNWQRVFQVPDTFSFPSPRSAVVLAGTHVVNGMMVCRPLSVGRVRGGSRWGDVGPSRLK